ncbi:hypothetical protein E3O52_05280 [Enterococcus faecium]|nr:hypothetical protein E3O52_05280 [Enterococcus faecium]UXD38531.1 hypothetical protein E3O61_11285 [Enterococcus faecium]
MFLINIFLKSFLNSVQLNSALCIGKSQASIKEVQECLEHKDIKTTMNIYAHVTPQSIKETGDRFAKFMGI